MLQHTQRMSRRSNQTKFNSKPAKNWKKPSAPGQKGKSVQNKETCILKRDMILNVTAVFHSNNTRNAQRTGTPGKIQHSCGAAKHPHKTDIINSQ